MDGQIDLLAPPEGEDRKEIWLSNQGFTILGGLPKSIFAGGEKITPAFF
jgi:hypothetical protein